MKAHGSAEVIAILRKWADFCRKSTGEPDRYMIDEIEYQWTVDGTRHADGSVTGELRAFALAKQISRWRIAVDGAIVAAPLTLWKISRGEK